MVTLNADIDCTLLKKLREDLKSSFKEKGLNLSYNYILMKACAVALKEQPMLNSYLEGNEVVLYGDQHRPCRGGGGGVARSVVRMLPAELVRNSLRR